MKLKELKGQTKAKSMPELMARQRQIVLELAKLKAEMHMKQAGRPKALGLLHYELALVKTFIGHQNSTQIIKSRPDKKK